MQMLLIIPCTAIMPVFFSQLIPPSSLKLLTNKRYRGEYYCFLDIFSPGFLYCERALLYCAGYVQVIVTSIFYAWESD